MKVGILGGGQLARMLSEAASSINIDTICIEKKENCSASYVTQVASIELHDIDKIIDCFKGVDCITYESENIPVDTIKKLEQHFTVYPGLKPLQISQDRLLEKDHLNHINIPTSAYLDINNQNDISHFANTHNFPIILKTRTNGYDGKGQYLCNDMEVANEALAKLKNQKIIAESFIHFDYEISVIAGRASSGEIIFYPLVKNIHKDGILRQSIAPFSHKTLESQAQAYAKTLLESFNYVGILAIEFFCVDDRLIVNEIAPRVHNSGHWTINGADTSQFENHIRAICNLPFGSSQAKGYSTMINCIEQHPKQLDQLAGLEHVYYYDYNKEPASKRKIGHININTSNQSELESTLKTLNQLI